MSELSLEPLNGTLDLGLLRDPVGPKESFGYKTINVLCLL